MVLTERMDEMSNLLEDHAWLACSNTALRQSELKWMPRKARDNRKGRCYKTGGGGRVTRYGFRQNVHFLFSLKYKQ
jgi:hypothetical protein